MNVSPPSAGSLPKWLEQPELGQADACVGARAHVLGLSSAALLGTFAAS